MKFRNWTIRNTLWFLASISTTMVIGIEIFNYYNTSKLSQSLHDIGRVQLPTVRSMTLADMMHDGLRAVVYRSIIASYSKEEKELAAAKAEYEEFSKNILSYISSIESVAVSADIKALTNEAKEKISDYVESGSKVISLTEGGKTDDAIKMLPAYQEKFEVLEEKLEKLGEKIETDAEKSVGQSELMSERAQAWVIAIAVLGTFLSLLFFYLVNRRLSGRLSVISNILGEGANEVGIAVTELSNASADLSNSSNQQSASIDQTASAIHEISSMVKRSAELSQNAEESARQSREQAEEGTSIIVEMVDSMKFIQEKTELLASQTSESNEKLFSIVKLIDEVVQKTQVINDIVFQTKLLSFNASVEAARAGENGKGFAVVAEEVGNLAQMSGNAAKEINSLLNESRLAVNNIVLETKNKVESALVSAKEAVTSGNSKAQKCGVVFTEIASSSTLLSEMVSNISQASRESSKGVEEISRAISDLSSATQDNATAAANCAEASFKLEGQVSKLRESANTLNQMVTEKNLIKKFDWKDTYALGVNQMDDEHKILIEKINFLADALSSKTNVLESFNELANYTKEHFSHEEQYMGSISYPELTRHKKNHTILLGQMEDFGNQLQAGQVNAGELMTFLNDWLLKHILGVDMKYARHSRRVAQDGYQTSKKASTLAS